jgi:F-type H+-transporting ATPase subunit beta
MNTGTVVQVIGPVIDVRFPDEVPAIYNSLKVTIGEGEAAREVICEVQQHLGDNKVRAVAMDSTDGLARGVEVLDTAAQITTPVGYPRSADQRDRSDHRQSRGRSELR